MIFFFNPWSASNMFVVFSVVILKLSNFCLRKMPLLIQRAMMAQLFFETLLEYEFASIFVNLLFKKFRNLWFCVLILP